MLLKSMPIRDKDSFDIITGIAAIIGVIIGVVFLVPVLYHRKWDTELWLVTSSIAIIIIVLITYCIKLIKDNGKLYKDYCDAPHKIRKLEGDVSQLKSEIDSGIEIQAKIAQTFHNFSHRYRDKIVKIHENPAKQNTDRKDLHGFAHYMVANVKEVFDVLTGSDCAVSIKLLDTQGVIRTLIRDAISSRERWEIDRQLPEYRYDLNTAFEVILDEDANQSYYMSNNLKTEQSYNNANKNWHKHYNACLVAPIRYIEIKEDGAEKSAVLGFICIDNKKGGFNEVGKDVLASYADHCFHLFNFYFKQKEMA